MLEEVGIYRVLVNLIEEHSLYLTDDDNRKLLVYKLAADTGGGLAPKDVQDILRMQRLVLQAQGGLSTDPPLGVAKILSDLRTTDKMLNPQERAFLEKVRAKISGGNKLSMDMMEALLKIYADKGF